MRRFDRGDLVRVTGTFENASGSNIDPASVRVKVRSPSGTITTYIYGTDAALIKDSTGVYHLDIDANESGTWYYRFYNPSGSTQAAAEASFTVERTQF